MDPDRIGCTGLSGGGWRTNIMAALEPRIKAAVAVGWMTTGDTQQPYNLAGAVEKATTGAVQWKLVAGGQLVGGRHPVRDAGEGDLLLGAGHPRGHRRL